jgi:hypothetical protein
VSFEFNGGDLFQEIRASGLRESSLHNIANLPKQLSPKRRISCRVSFEFNGGDLFQEIRASGLQESSLHNIANLSKPKCNYPPLSSSTLEIYFGNPNSGFGTSGILTSHIRISSEAVIAEMGDLAPRVHFDQWSRWTSDLREFFTQHCLPPTEYELVEYRDRLTGVPRSDRRTRIAQRFLHM